MRLLFVCTGNLCRSPMAEGLAIAWLMRYPGGTSAVAVRSAGTEAPSGMPMNGRSAEALLARGGDPFALRSKPLTSEMVNAADLVLTMTRYHRRIVLEQAPRALRRTFTLMEAADLLSRANAGDAGALTLDEWTRELARRWDAGRAYRVSSAADDITDPVGERTAAHEAVAETIESALEPLLTALLANSSPSCAIVPVGAPSEL